MNLLANFLEYVVFPSFSFYPFHLLVFLIVVVLMGLFFSSKVALWTNNTLPLDFPSIVWKRLVGLEPTIEDLNVCFVLSHSLANFVE
jgi:hypothetical protein